MPEEITFPKKRLIMYVIGFVFNLSYAIPTYVNSSFLAQFTSDSLVGIIYTASSILAIMTFVEMSNLLRKFGNLRVTISLLCLALLSLVGLATGTHTLAIMASFMLNFVTIALINFTLDIFLEEFSPNSRTGGIRGTFFSVVNTAWLIAPLIASAILGNRSVIHLYSNMYIVAAMLIVPVIFLVFFGLRGIKDPLYTRVPFWKSFGEIWADRDIKRVLFIEFLLQFFYAWMIIYAPLYLHDVIGFDWPTIGIIFTIMLLPFPILGEVLGKLADKHGEKKAISIGFIIIAISTISIAFVTDHNPVVWAVILFMTRVGSATVDVMADIYFFKHVDASKSNVISFARMSRPLAYIVSPVIATILFTVLDMKGLFIFLGILMFYGLRYTLTLKDTRVTI